MGQAAVLSAAELDRLERLVVASDRPVGGQFAGQYRSRARGHSLDFADWREYVEGDDPRDIDVQAWVRLDQLLVRLYEADVDLSLHVVIDTSASMGFGAKHHQACRVGAAVGAAALMRNENVSLAPLAWRQPRRFRGRTAVPAMLAAMNGWVAEGPTPLRERARDLVRAPRRSGMIVVVSDFLTADWGEAVDLFGARREQVLAVCITSAADETIDLAGEVQLVDAETGELVDVDLSPKVWSELSAKRVALRRALASRVARIGGRFVEFPDTADLLGEVVPILLGTGVLR